MRIQRLNGRFAVLGIGILAAGCTTGYQRNQEGVVVYPKDGPAVQIRVVDDAIVRVSATAENGERESLSVIQSSSPAPQFTVSEESGSVNIKTPALKVSVLKKSGAVSFFDSTGNLLLNEPAEGGKMLEPAEVMGENTFHVRQIFESPSDEAFYGLGQHQNGVINYKGTRIDLKQYNLIAAVPFLVSTRNYGMLWDNTSRTLFGDPREYQPLSTSLKLYDAEGNEGGLTAEYFTNKVHFTARTESIINHESLYDQENYPAGFKPNNKARIVWNGMMESSISGEHHFRLYSSSFCKLWINGTLQVDSWRQNWCPWERIVKVPMEAGKRYSIKMEWIPDGGYLGLNHLDPMPAEEKNLLSFQSDVGDGIDYYFVYGKSMDDIISEYRKLTGKAPMMPNWSLGMWQCRERYKTQKELMDVVREFRQREIPLDNIVQDWNYWPEDQWGSHDFDPARFPDAKEMVSELHKELHAHIMISVWPKFYVDTEHYNQFEENGWLYRRNVEKQERDWIGEGYVSTFYDPYSAGARGLFWKQIEAKLFNKGFDAWWLDATEPDIHSNLPDDEYLKRIGPTALGSAARYRNSFSLMNAKGIYEGQRASASDQRVFILTRSAFSGQQRYGAATWSGDIATTWYDLKTQIACGLNFCMSGIPYWTMDIGGFAVEPRFLGKVSKEDQEEWRELQTRWFQFGTFCPLFRVHGQYPYREMFNIAPEDHPAYQSMLKYDQLRYRLMPYIYSLAGRVTQEDYTIMRALVMDFANDPAVRSIDDQFMFGPDIMVCPVTQYKARTREVYLPKDSGWIEFKSGAYYEGGQTISVAAPYEEIPLFVREGSILPVGPAVQYVGEKPADPIRLYVYTGADGSFTLYEDEGLNYNYENGAFCRISFHYNEAAKTLTMGPREGEFKGMLKERTFEIVWISPERSDIPHFDDPADGRVHYLGNEIKIKRTSHE